jgi:murein DD-endopeptidase MepM/ murein hydrolase activator NlpD
VKRRILIGLFLVSMLVAPLLAAAEPDRAGPVSISYDFQWIRQGRVGIVRVTGAEIAEVRGVFQERLYPFYPEKQSFVGLISADMNQDIGIYPFQVWIKYTDGQGDRIDKEIEVNYGEFGRSPVTISASLSPLLDPDLEQAEFDKLNNIIGRFTPARYWEDQGFITPDENQIIGWFGAWRLYNETYWRQHTGTDYSEPVGTPVLATASGRVMLSEMVAIRGGYILIDHGWGIYSGYAHLSQRFVVPGQWVRQGDVIGLTGLNGRSSGAHLHWEIAVGGIFVSPEDFAAMGLGNNSTDKVG